MHSTLYWSAVVFAAISAGVILTIAYLDLPTKRERERVQR